MQFADELNRIQDSISITNPCASFDFSDSWSSGTQRVLESGIGAGLQNIYKYTGRRNSMLLLLILERKVNKLTYPAKIMKFKLLYVMVITDPVNFIRQIVHITFILLQQHYKRMLGWSNSKWANIFFIWFHKNTFS